MNVYGKVEEIYSQKSSSAFVRFRTGKEAEDVKKHIEEGNEFNLNIKWAFGRNTKNTEESTTFTPQSYQSFYQSQKNHEDKESDVLGKLFA